MTKNYETFASVYDAIMDDSLYDLWMDFSLRHLPKTTHRKQLLDLSQVGKYDFVTCYSDSICYMQDEIEVGDVFKEVYNVLEEDGIFIFDVHSTYQVDDVFPSYSYHENAEEFAMVWDSYADEAPHSVVHELTFFIQDEDGRFSRFDEVHEERTYDVLTYDILLEQAGFKSFKWYADFEDKEPTKTSARWFFVAQK